MGAGGSHRAACICFPDTDRADGAPEIGGSSERKDRASELHRAAASATSAAASAAGAAEAAAAEDHQAGGSAPDSAAAVTAAGCRGSVQQSCSVAAAGTPGTSGAASGYPGR